MQLLACREPHKINQVKKMEHQIRNYLYKSICTVRPPEFHAQKLEILRS